MHQEKQPEDPRASPSPLSNTSRSPARVTLGPPTMPSCGRQGSKSAAGLFLVPAPSDWVFVTARRASPHQVPTMLNPFLPPTLALEKKGITEEWPWGEGKAEQVKSVCPEDAS